MVDRDEVRAGGKRAFDHYFGEGSRDGREDVAAAEHGGTDGHEVCDCVFSIADELSAVS